MAKKLIANSNPFGEPAEDHNPLDQAASALFGTSNGLATKDTGKQVANPLSIFNIQPDPIQPRRAIPHHVREKWDGNPHNIEKVFSDWLETIRHDRQSNGHEERFDLDAYLHGHDEGERPKQLGPLETTLIELAELAASIRRDGLTNPITVYSTGVNQYQIETGERRWMSYHLLYISFPNEREKWSKIPARVMPEANVWRQASENAARQDLNAIARSRQYAVLFMDLVKTYENKTFRPPHEFPHEQAYYAQVLDDPIPYGKAGLLNDAMGYKNRVMLKRYRDLLRLPHVLWDLADDYNCPEGVLREIIDGTNEIDEAFALSRFHRWLNDQRTPKETVSAVQTGNEVDGPILGNKTSIPASPTLTSPTLLMLVPKIGSIFAGHRRKVEQYINPHVRVGEDEKRAIRKMLTEQREWLEEIRRLLD
jgi:hypothetical protein